MMISKGDFKTEDSFALSIELILDFFTDLKSNFPSVRIKQWKIKSGVMYETLRWKDELRRKYVKKKFKLKEIKIDGIFEEEEIE